MRRRECMEQLKVTIQGSWLSLINIALLLVLSSKRLKPMKRRLGSPMPSDWVSGYRHCVARVSVTLAKNTLSDLAYEYPADILDTVKTAFPLNYVSYVVVTIALGSSRWRNHPRHPPNR
jgi:hypothetical protein